MRFAGAEFSISNRFLLFQILGEKKSYNRLLALHFACIQMCVTGAQKTYLGQSQIVFENSLQTEMLYSQLSFHIS